MEGSTSVKRSPTRWRTRFGSWMDGVTVNGVLSGLEQAGHPVTKCVAYQWLAGRSSPRLPVARALLRLSGGSITLDDILGHRAEVSSAGTESKHQGAPITRR